jgi:predicted Zn-dependent peptidase
VGYLHVPGSKSVSIFSYLPLGLACDEADRCGWAHLIEHLVIRTTTPGALTEVNAETLADHMRLDFYGNADNWRQGLARHTQWLQGLPFSEQSLRAETAQANAEIDVVAPKLFTHKFAFSAWDQACRHARTDVGVKANLKAAALKDVQAYRDQHLFIPKQTFVCAIGGVEPKEFIAAAEESIGKLASRAKPPAPASTQPSSRDASWDVGARHVMLSWPIPGPVKTAEHATMMVAARIVTIRCAQNSNLSKLAGPVLAGADLHTPEDWYFYVSAALRPGASAEEALRAMKGQVDGLKQLKDSEMPVSMIAGMMAAELRPQDPEKVKTQMPAGVSAAMIEAQAAILWGMNEFRYGAQKQPLARALDRMTIEQIRRSAGKWLDAKQCAVLTLRPSEH